MYHEDSENKILDLTLTTQEEEGPGYSCDHCEIPMRISDEDLSTADGSIVVKRGSYHCSKCGMVWDSLDQQQQRVIKSQEKIGPRIPKPSENFLFESIPSNTGTIRSRREKESFDPEPNERERLEAEGCTVMEERITDSSGRTIIKRS
jgi:hypothetical protein